MTGRPAAVTLEEAHHLLGFGWPATGVAARLGVTPGAVARAARRFGDIDLARRFERLDETRPERRTRPSCADCGAPCNDNRRTRCAACAPAHFHLRPQSLRGVPKKNAVRPPAPTRRAAA